MYVRKWVIKRVCQSYFIYLLIKLQTMKNTLLIAVSALALILSSCGSETTEQRTAVGGKLYGGEFKFMSSEKVDNLFPMSSVDVYSQRLNSQIYEPLLKLDMETMKVVPSIAESYKVSAINFRRSVKYGFGVLGTAAQYRLARMGLTSPARFSNEGKRLSVPAAPAAP